MGYVRSAQLQLGLELLLTFPFKRLDLITQSSKRRKRLKGNDDSTAIAGVIRIRSSQLTQMEKTCCSIDLKRDGGGKNIKNISIYLFN